MATKPVPDAKNSSASDAATPKERLEENLARIEELSQRMVAALAHKPQGSASINAPEPDVFTKAAGAYWSKWLQNPANIIEQQTQYWSKTLTHFVEAQQALASGKFTAPPQKQSGSEERRFTNPLWDSHPYFNFVKQQYLINADAIRAAVDGLQGLDDVEHQRIRFVADQIADMLAPTNFLATNPDALEKAIATEGESLVRGLENLVRDLEANHGELVIRLADDTAFQVGENIASTPGQVVYRNHMMELIQFSPTTETVRETPLLLFPPWINKFYILDLKPANSFIRWVVDQGYTLFVVSWINPDKSYSGTGLDDYVQDGYLTALDKVNEICGTKQTNAIGYCIAGTTLALTLALLKKRGQKPVKSATFLTTLTDFSDQGEFTPFLQDDFMDGIEDVVTQVGMLPSFIMSRTFSFLRANDLFYGPAIRSYMMGETPPAFDLLYWNGDGTNLPGRMALDYLRGLCQRNEFVDGGFELLGERLHIKDVDIPLFAVATEADHIARARDSFRGIQQMGARSKQFLLGGAGHIAGIVNPPHKNKYGFKTGGKLSLPFEAWKAASTEHDGSWWPHWETWLARRSGKKIPARKIGETGHKGLCAAPGDYVRLRAAEQYQ